MTEITHGASSYTNYACPCDICREGHRLVAKQMRTDRYAERVMMQRRLIHPRATHGALGGYLNFGCRCASCTIANTQAQAARRQRARDMRDAR